MNSSETLTTAHSLLHLHSYTKESLWTLLRHWAIMDGDESRVDRELLNSYFNQILCEELNACIVSLYARKI